MNGAALLSMTEEDFTKRAPQVSTLKKPIMKNRIIEKSIPRKLLLFNFNDHYYESNGSFIQQLMFLFRGRQLQ